MYFIHLRVFQRLILKSKMFPQNILKVQQVMRTQGRSFGQNNKKFIYKLEGKKYEQIRYYPRYGVYRLELRLYVLNYVLLCRDPDHKDIPIENPVKLFRIQRIKPLKGNPYWEKEMLKLLGVAEKVAIVKLFNRYVSLTLFSNLFLGRCCGYCQEYP